MGADWKLKKTTKQLHKIPLAPSQTPPYLVLLEQQLHYDADNPLIYDQ